jgi:hypothetical protein
VLFRIYAWIKDMIFLISDKWFKIWLYYPIKNCGEENVRIEIPGFRARRYWWKGTSLYKQIQKTNHKMGKHDPE